jgi:hypothetical protein
MVNREDSEQIQALEERAVQRDREIAEFSSTVARLTAKVEVEAIRASFRRQPPPTLLRARPAPGARHPAPGALRARNRKTPN